MKVKKENAAPVSTQMIMMTAMMMALIMVTTFIIRVPVPGTHGYIHFGDCMIFLAVMILGIKGGTAAAAFGSAMADIIGGFAFYAPATLIVKACMALIFGAFLHWAFAKWKKNRIIAAALGMLLGGLTMVAGYWLAECIMYGSMIVAFAGVPMNCLQFLVGGVLAGAVAKALAKSPAAGYFKYPLS